jgi:ribonuclease HI
MHWYAWWKLCYPKKEGGMGFRDFHSFNLAMLGKQVWRLISDPTSLCARVLGAKYFPDNNVLRAGPKGGCSFTWQSISASIPTFNRGYIWRVGDGEKINIWSDPWIPSSHDRKVTTLRGNTVYTKVSQLLDPLTGQWDEILLRSIFNQLDVNRILRIPLNVHGFEDFIAWSFSKHGMYTVRSAYHLQWRYQFGSTGRLLTSPGVSATNPVWKTVWKLKLPSKIKIFIWRSLHGILPVKSTLVNRHIGTSGQCPICSSGPEDIAHLLFRCPKAKEVWESLGLANSVDDAILADRAGSAILEHILCKEEQNFQNFDLGLKEVMMVTCWYLWWLRRRRTHDEETPPVNRCRLSILSITSNAKSANSKLNPLTATWVKPMPRWMKVNVDASFHVDSGTGSVAAVLRDYQGRFVAAATRFLPYVGSASMAEALALKEGLGLATRKGCNAVIAESDSLENIEALNGVAVWWTGSAAIFADCIDLALSIGEVSYVHCPREANKTAHELAKVCHIDKDSCNWDDDPPSFLLCKLIEDVTIH